MNGEVCNHNDNVRQDALTGRPSKFNFSRQKLHIWAICGNGVILGPNFVDGNVTGIAYIRMLDEFVYHKWFYILETSIDWEGHFRNVWWVQGATQHRVIDVRVD